MIARLRPGATVAELEAQMATIVDRVVDRIPARRGFVEGSGFGAYAVPIREQLVGDARNPAPAAAGRGQLSHLRDRVLEMLHDPG